MGKITTINSQTNYRNNLKVVPFEKTILNNYFSKIDQVWEYAPDVEMVEIQKEFGSDEYYPYQMRVERVFNAKTQDTRSDDWKEFLSPEPDFDLPYGLYLRWKNNYWIVYNKENLDYPTRGVICRRCITTFNWVDEWGNLRIYPVVIGKPKEASDYVNVQFTNPGGFNVFYMQLDEHSKYIRPNDIFMIGNTGYWSSYKVQGGGVANYLREETLNSTETGLLSLICYIYEGNDDTDNLEIGVSQYYEKIFTMELDQYNIEQYSGFSIVIHPTIKRGIAIKNDVALIWQSADENVATVDGDGLITLINKGETDITCTMEKNSSVSQIVHIINLGQKEEGQDQPDEQYETRVYPNITEIKQGTSETYNIEYYVNDILSVPQDIKIELDRNGVPKKNFTFKTSNNSFTITNKLKYFDAPLKVNIYVDNITLSKEYWLVGAL